MIETANTNELVGQLDLTDVLPETDMAVAATATPEGYDAEGNLLNEDYPPIGDRGTDHPEEVPAEADATPPSLAEIAALASGEAGLSPQAHAAKPQDAGETRAPDLSEGAGRTQNDQAAMTDAQARARLDALATEINAITEQTRGVVISAALAVGKRLIEAKTICPEGRWLEWLEHSVDYSERKAQDMMRLYAEYGRDGAVPDSIAALDYSKAVALLSAPAEAREALAERAAGEDMSVRQLQGEIKRLKAEKAAAQMQIEGLETQIDAARHNISQMDEEQQKYDQAIVDKDRELKEVKRALAGAAEKVSLAQAKADAAEASANELRRLHSDAEDRAAASAQRASDAVSRANQAAKDLAEARAKIAALEEQGTGDREQEVRTVEVVPEEVQRELDQLRAQLAEARAMGQGTGKAETASAAEKFKWFYANQMKPAFTTALALLKEVAREDGKTADLFATALTNACKALMGQLGVSE